MDHKYSTYTVFFFFFILLVGFVWSLESSDLDEVCNQNNSFFFRYNGVWGCANITDMEINVSYNNITNLYTNVSQHTVHFDGYESFSEGLNTNRTEGNVDFTKRVTAGDFRITDVAGVARDLVITSGTKTRWVWRLANAGAETGSNAGSDFQLFRYADAGTFLGTPMSINRKTGDFSFQNSISIGEDLEVDGLSYFYGTNQFHGATIYYAMARFRDAIPLYFGSANDAEIKYNQTTQNLEIDTNRGAGGGILDIKHSVLIGENLLVEGNITSENVFIPQYIFSHTNRTQPLFVVNVWTNVTFDQEVADIKFGIEHISTDDTNHTFTIIEDGLYEADYDFDVEDSSGTPSDIDVAGRLVLVNGTEVIGSVFETDIAKQGISTELSHDFLFRALAGEQFKFQFVADNADVQISTHGAFGDHPESATVVIKKVANL